MNGRLARQYDVVKIYRQLRDDLMAELSDEDLRYTPGGENKTLGELCRDLGDVQKAYIGSFATFTISFDEQTDDPELANSVSRIREWYTELDAEMESALESIPDGDAENRMVIRTETFQLPMVIHLDVFREALIIFYGKVSVYLKAMGRPRPTKWDKWLA